MSNLNTKSVYFYCCPSGTPDFQPYQHALVCLAEGLKEIGVKFYADRNYWRLSPDTEEYLFVHDPNITPDDCSVVVLDGEWFTQGRDLPEGLFKPKRNYVTTYFELSELMHSVKPEFNKFDFVFRGAYNSRFAYAANVRPWAYALSERMLRETSGNLAISGRKRQILSNFRHSRPPHSVRKLFQKEFLPNISKIMEIDERVDQANDIPSEPYHHLQWDQTGRRHHPMYYARLKESVACACFGGFFVSPWPRNQRSLLSIAIKRTISKLGWKTDTIQQWDSWRLWESWAAGCVTFQADFRKYGFVLPVMPENWQHYIGVDLDNVADTVERIAANPGILEEIAVSGRHWALTHYAPIPSALRFLEMTLKES